MLRLKTSQKIQNSDSEIEGFKCAFVWVALGSLAVFFLMATSACNLYQSPDRSSFNQNAVAGAPKQSTLLSLDQEAAEIGASSCALFADPMNEAPTVTRQENGTKQLVVAHNIAYGSARSIVCNFDFEHTPDQDFSAFIARATSQVEQLADRLQL